MTSGAFKFFPSRTAMRLDLERTVDGAWRVRTMVSCGDRTLTTHETVAAPETSASAAVATALQTPALARYRRTPVSVSLGPELIQYKSLRGLPPLATDRALSDAVRENASRFFLRNGVPIVTSQVSRDVYGVVWGAAVERPLLDAVQEGCRLAGYRLSTIVPGSRTASVWWEPSADIATAAAAKRRQYLVWSLAALAIVGGALIVPGASAHLAAGRDQRTYHHYGPQARAGDSLAQRLAAVSSGLNEAASLVIRHRSVMTVLALLTEALPDGQTVTSLAIDTTGGTVVMLAPHAGEALSAVERVPGVTEPEIVGPVTQEALRSTGPGMPPKSAERATIHFRWSVAQTGAGKR